MENTCPLCKRNDAIRKVSSIVSSENADSTFVGPTLDLDGDFGFAVVGRKATSLLAKKLAPPKKPVFGFFESKESKDERYKFWTFQLEIWNRFYYCYRDDVVFEFGSQSASPPHKMLSSINFWADANMFLYKSQKESLKRLSIPLHELIEEEDYSESEFIEKLHKMKMPHVTYAFSSSKDAINSFSAIPGTTFDKEKKKFFRPDKIKIKVEDLQEGFYQVTMYGNKIDLYLISLIHRSCENNRGYLVSEIEPEPHFFARIFRRKAHPEKVVFLREEKKDDRLGYRIIYKGPDKISAKVFLLGKKGSTSVDLIVNTPEGDFIRDYLGIRKLETY